MTREYQCPEAHMVGGTCTCGWDYDAERAVLDAINFNFREKKALRLLARALAKANGEDIKGVLLKFTSLIDSEVVILARKLGE